jgi:hypothetical protein
MALPLKVGVVLAVASTTSTRHLQLFLLLAGVFVRFYFVFPSCCFLPGLVFAMLSPFVRYFVLVGASSLQCLVVAGGFAWVPLLSSEYAFPFSESFIADECFNSIGTSRHPRAPRRRSSLVASCRWSVSVSSQSEIYGMALTEHFSMLYGED